jgi:hypothetical protein
MSIWYLPDRYPYPLGIFPLLYRIQFGFLGGVGGEFHQAVEFSADRAILVPSPAASPRAGSPGLHVTLDPHWPVSG